MFSACDVACVCGYFFRSRKTHPGPVVHLSDNPLDASKVSTMEIYANIIMCVKFSFLVIDRIRKRFSGIVGPESKERRRQMSDERTPQIGRVALRREAVHVFTY